MVNLRLNVIAQRRRLTGISALDLGDCWMISSAELCDSRVSIPMKESRLAKIISFKSNFDQQIKRSNWTERAFEVWVSNVEFQTFNQRSLIKVQLGKLWRNSDKSRQVSRLPNSLSFQSEEFSQTKVKTLFWISECSFVTNMRHKVYDTNTGMPKQSEQVKCFPRVKFAKNERERFLLMRNFSLWNFSKH